MSAIGSIAIAIGAFCTLLDIWGNGAQDADWAGLMLTIAILGGILVGADHYGGKLYALL